MLLLIIYVLIALVFSFLCSVSEAVILTMSDAYIALTNQKGRKHGKILFQLKGNISRTLSAILILNTIAHTLGAAGAGAQAAAVFGNAYVGLSAVILTILILVFSEIIPKTIGTHYWRGLAPVIAYWLNFLIWILAPLVIISELITSRFVPKDTSKGPSRSEFAALADLSHSEQKLARQESIILKNLLLLSETSIRDAMTPASVVFKLPASLTVSEYFYRYNDSRFSRIPVHAEDPDLVLGFVLRSDLLLALARGNSGNSLSTYQRELTTVLDSMKLSRAFETILKLKSHMMLVVNEYGGTEGIITLEDLIETLLGIEILDEGDKTINMKKLARRLWKRRAREMGLEIEKD